MTTYLLPFEKMHGLGNDFVIVENRHLPNRVDLKKLALNICNRNFGIGADGLIIVDFSSTGETDFVWDYFNSDGSNAEMCGNGMRCFAKYVYERGLTENVTFSVMTLAGIIKPLLEDDGTVTINMGQPKIGAKCAKLLVDVKELNYTYVEIGNPHCILFMDSEISEEQFYKLGPKIEKHPEFPRGVNVEFVRILSRSEIVCRVWERGAGATLACGTGACAVLVAANINDYVNNNAKIFLPGGPLKVTWNKEKNSLYLNGPVTSVFTGQYNLELKEPSTVKLDV